MDNEFYNLWQPVKQSNWLDRNIIMKAITRSHNLCIIESTILGRKDSITTNFDGLNTIIKQIYFICKHFIQTRHMTRYSDVLAKSHIRNFVCGVGLLRHLITSNYPTPYGEYTLLNWCDSYIKRYVDINLLVDSIERYQKLMIFQSQGEADCYGIQLLNDHKLKTVTEKQIMAHDRFAECLFPTTSGEYVLRYVDYEGEDYLESTIYPKLEYVRANNFTLHDSTIIVTLTSDHYSENLVPAMSNLMDILSKMIHSVELAFPECKYATKLRGVMYSIEDACTKR